MYTPHVGRWLSRDDAGFIDGPNRYLYVKNGPVDVSDPSGLDPSDDEPLPPSLPQLPGKKPNLGCCDDTLIVCKIRDKIVVRHPGRQQLPHVLCPDHYRTITIGGKIPRTWCILCDRPDCQCLFRHFCGGNVTNFALDKDPQSDIPECNCERVI